MDIISIIKELQKFTPVEELLYSIGESRSIQKTIDDNLIKELIKLSGKKLNGNEFDLCNSKIEQAIESHDYHLLGELFFNEKSNFYDDENISVSKAVRFIDPDIHQHDYYEIEYILQGKIKHIVKSHSTDLSIGDVVIIPPHTEHNLLLMDSDCIAVILGIRQTNFFTVFSSFINENSPLSRYFVSSFHNNNDLGSIIFECGNDEFVRDIFLRLYEQKIHKPPYYKEYQNHLTQTLFYHLMQNNSIIETYPGNKESKLMQDINNYIRNHYADINLQELSHAFGYSVPYLSSKIHSYFNIPFSKLLTNIRMEIAKEMLDSEIAVKTVSENTGYKVESYFISNFKSCYGITPKQYQLQKHK